MRNRPGALSDMLEAAIARRKPHFIAFRRLDYVGALAWSL